MRIWHASYYIMNSKECAQNDLYLQLRIGGMDIVLGEGAEAIIFIYRERRYRESRPCAAFLLRHCLVRWQVDETELANSIVIRLCIDARIEDVAIGVCVGACMCADFGRYGKCVEFFVEE